jgi:hypothetical protein
MESIMFLGGLAPAIGIIGGGEIRGEGARKGDTRTELPARKGKNKGFGEKATGLGGKEDSLSAKLVTLIGGGVIKPGVGKYSKVYGLDQGTTLGERGVTRIYPSNPRSGGENATGTLPKFKFRETPTDGMVGKWEVYIGVSKGGQ